MWRSGLAILAGVLTACGGTQQGDDDMGCDPGTLAIAAGPAMFTRDTMATFTFATTGSCVLECKVDDGAVAACDSPYTVTVVEGAHTLQVETVGAALPATTSYAWTVDTMSPITTAGCPAMAIASDTTQITFTASESGATFYCKVDNQAEAPCTSPFTLTGLSESSHTFSVYAVDRAGNQELPTSCTFLVDTTGPAVEVTQSPSTVCSVETTLILFDATNEPTDSVTFTCALDGGTPTDCGTGDNAGEFTIMGLAIGMHSVVVVAHDALGNAGPDQVVPFTVAADSDQPTITFTGNSPQVNACETGPLAVGGEVVTTPSNTVAFSVLDNGVCAGLPITATCTLRLLPGNAIVVGYDNVDCASGAFVFGAPFPLVDGEYRVTVTATDGAGNVSQNTRGFVVDGTPPMFATIAVGTDAVVGATPTTASITVTGGVFDPSETPPTTVACTIDGTAAPCSGGTVSVPALPETTTGYTLAATLVDCVGNTRPATTRFWIDTNPPVFANIDCATATNCATNSALGTAQLTLSVADAITNVAAIDCIVDYDANGENPELGNVFTFAPCGLANLPTATSADQTSPRVPRTYSGTLTLNELSPGRHRVWYRTRDNWNHTSSVSSVQFTLDETNAVAGYYGHVTAIGHDFVATGASALKILGNALARSRAFAFARLFRILILDLGKVDDDAVGATPKNRVLQTLFINFAVRGFTTVEWSGNAAAADEDLAGRLLGRDVLIVLDQNDAIRSAQIGQKSAWITALTTFVQNGGIAVVLDGKDASNALSNTVQMFVGAGATGPFSTTDIAPGVPANTIFGTCAANPLSTSVAAPYAQVAHTVAFVPEATADVIFTLGVTATPTYGAVVMDKRYPAHAAPFCVTP